MNRIQKTRRTSIGIGNPFLLLTVTALFLTAACSKSKDSAAPETDAATTPVQVASATRAPIQEIVSAEAVLYPVRQANIMPKISAPVARFLVQRGDHVREGQIVAVLEDRDLAASAQESKQLYDQAQASYRTVISATMPDDLTKAQTDVTYARQAFDAASKVFESRQNLFRQGAIAQKLVDDAKVAMVQAQTQQEIAQQHLQSLQKVGQTEQMKGAEAQRDAAKAHYESVAAQLSYAEIRSPISGIVSDRPASVGEMASSSSALISIVDVSRVVARANVPVHQAAAIKVGKPAKLSGPGGELDGKVTVVSPAVDPSTTTVEVWVEAINPGDVLKPGSTVNVAIDAGEVPDAIVVPVAALLASDDGGERVMVAGPDGLAHEHAVEVGVRSGDTVQLLKGVNAGEQVITQGALGLDDKAKVEVTKPDKAGADEK